MVSEVAVGTMRRRGHPLLRTLVSFPIACFSGALLTDIAYAATADMIWADFSAWLLAAGMILGVLAGLVACVDALTYRRGQTRPPIGLLAVGGLLTLVLGLFDNLVHSRDAWTSVVPLGLALSAATVVVMLATIWLGSVTVLRTGVAGYGGVRS